MLMCRECGHSSSPLAKFCTHCGAPLRERRAAELPELGFTTPPAAPPFASPRSAIGGAALKTHSNALLIKVAAGILALGTPAVVIGANIGGSSSGVAIQGVASPADGLTPSIAVPYLDSTAEPDLTSNSDPGYTESSETTAPEDPQEAKAELERIEVRDQPAVAALVDTWVPELSAKKPGLVADGITYDYPAILQNYLNLRAEYGDVLLLKSGDFTSFKYRDFWVTVYDQSYSDGRSTNSWCDGESIPRDDCYAKLLSHSSPYKGATVLRSG